MEKRLWLHLIGKATMKTNSKSPSLSLVLLLMLAMTNLLAMGQVENPNDKTLSPYFLVKSGDGSAEQLPLLSTKATVHIAGVIAAVTVTQVYKNDGNKPIEAIYVFPASTRAAVNRMKMTIGERTIEALIKEKQKARQEYEQAREQGQTASLLEQQRPNVFQMNVANIMPGDRIEVLLEYAELLIPEKGLYEFVFPTVVGPRYSNQPLASARSEDKWVANPFTHQGEAPSYTFDFSCQLNAGIPISDLRLSSHEADINYLSRKKASITLKNKNQGNKDVILQYRLCGKKLESGLLVYEGKDENFFLAMIQPPVNVNPACLPPREYVFIVDVSGSMSGYPLEISKKLMSELLGKLKNTDLFNILLFAGGSQLFSEKSMQANPVNIKAGIAFINNQQGGGGTELLPALKRALALGSGEDLARTFIIATDGYVAVEKEAFSLIRNNLNKASFFAFGIGSSVNRYLIEGIAHAGMGETFVVTQQSEAEAMASRFREYVERPVLTDIKISYKGINVYDVEPASIPDVFSERPVIVFGKYKGKIDGASISLSGSNGEGIYKESLAFSGAGTGSDNSALRYLWARERIRNLDDFGGTNNETDAASLKKQICALGLSYNLLTQYTSFVAIDSEIRNKSGQSATVIQPLPLPEGVSDQAIGVGMTKSINYNAPSKGYKSVGTSKNYVVEDAKAPMIKEKLEEKPIYTMLEEVGGFPGGEIAMKKFIREHLVYPAEAKRLGITGTVYVSFTINTNGTLGNIKVVRGIGGGCNAEASRLVKAMPKWKAARKNGIAVKSEYTIAIQFPSAS